MAGGGTNNTIRNIKKNLGIVAVLRNKINKKGSGTLDCLLGISITDLLE